MPGETTGRLLVVDDEPPLLRLLQHYLERSGFQVDTCQDPQSAIELLQQNPAAYHTAVVDQTLKGMNGEELIAALRGHNPQLKGIITSGYPYRPRGAGIQFLQKPFLPKDLGALLT